MSQMYVVIMAGGRGERFWPVSTPRLPKPFVRLTSERTLFAETVLRARQLVPAERIVVVVGAEQVGAVSDQAPEILPENILAEPVGRNTAACLAFATQALAARDPDATMLALPADHDIPDIEAFQETMTHAAPLAASAAHLITFGIRPTRPDTGYGYIHAPAGSERVGPALRVRRFVEKPDAETARRFFADGGYYWNSGIFLWHIDAFAQALTRHLPDLWRAMGSVAEALGTDRYDAVLREIYAMLPEVSVDVGVMEKAENVLLVPAAFAWDDVGTWGSLGRLLPRDAEGNVVVGPHVGIETLRCILRSEGPLIATLGVADLVIVATPSAVLVTTPERAADLKRLVAALARGT